MAVTVISRPVGHKLSTTEIDAVIYDNGGDAVVYVPGGHTLSDGDYVFIESNFDAYNGFKYVDSIAYDQFKIRESEGGSYVSFKQTAEILLFVSELEHGFQCVHLPIVYELYSDIFPINTIEESYTNRIVSFATDSNGYTAIQASTNFIGISTLDYIELIGTGDLAGIYQVIELVDPDEIIINLAYDAANDFSGYEIRKYYNNYFVTVNVYGGLDVAHRWYDEKPSALLATLKFIPDSDGKIKFSISEILKGDIETRNNLTLDTLPNNLDFYTQFYITYSESYDTSDGVDITVFTSEVTEDSFNGHALNSILPFKSLNQGHMSDYIASDTPARWLHTQDRPIAIAGYFFDISFINQYEDADIEVTVYKSLNDVVSETEIIEIANPGQGIIRVPLEIDTGFDQYCVQSVAKFSAASFPALSEYANIAGAGIDWTTGSAPTVTLAISETSDPLRVTAVMPSGSYSFNLNTSFTVSSLTVYFRSGTTIVAQQSISTGAQSYDIVLSSDIDNIQFIAVRGAIIGSSAITINSFILLPPDDITLTEQICIDVVDDCNTFVNDNLRLTEGGQFRELE